MISFFLSAMGIVKMEVGIHLGRSWSLSGIPLQQVCHQVDGFGTGVWDECLQITGNTLRPPEIHGTS